MPEPKALNLGGFHKVAAESNTAPAPAAASIVVLAPQTMDASPSLTTVQPLKMDEIGEFGKGTASAGAVTDKLTAITHIGDMDALGQSLNALVDAAKGYDPNKWKGFLGWIIKKKHDIEQHYATVDSQVETLTVKVSAEVDLFRSRVKDLEALYDMNEQYKAQLTQGISDMEDRLVYMESNIPEAVDGDMSSAQKKQDWLTVIAMGRKRQGDMRAAEVLCEQQSPQIKLTAQNSIALAQAFDNVRDITIPALKQQFTIYIMNLEQEKGADLNKSIVDTNNAVIQATAKKLGMVTQKVQESLNAPLITVDTLKVVSDQLITSIGQVQTIRDQMYTRLQTERPQIEQLRTQLAQKLAQTSPHMLIAPVGGGSGPMTQV